jgi:alpha-2-macroglobulin
VGNYDGLLDYWDDTSRNHGLRAQALVRQDRSSGLLPKAARWLAEHRDGDYWYSTKQTRW